MLHCQLEHAMVLAGRDLAANLNHFRPAIFLLMNNQLTRKQAKRI